MSNLYIREYTAAAVQQGEGVPVMCEPGTDQGVITISASAASSAAFGANTAFVRVHTDAICSIAFGTAPSATTANARMAANSTEYFGVIGGQKLSVIQNT